MSSTNWTEYLFHQTRVVQVSPPPGCRLTNMVLRLDDDSELFYSFHTSLNTARVYLLDRDDKKALESCRMEVPPSLTDFMRFFPKKRIYLRSFTSEVVNRDASRRVFADEVWEIFPLLLAQQDGNLDKYDVKVSEVFRKRWRLKYQTIDLEELGKALDDFGVDKSLLTIVPDIVNYATITVDVPMLFGTTTAYVYTHDKTKAMCATQAIFTMFKRIVMLIKWNQHCDPVSMKMAKNMVLQEMEHILKHKHCYVPHTEVNRIVDSFHENFQFLIDAHSPYHLFTRYDFNDLMPVEGFLKLVKEFSLEEHYPGAHLDKKQCKKAMIPTWKVHILLLLDWSRMFFGEEHVELSEMVLHGIQHLVPLMNWTGPEDLMKVVLKLDEEKHQPSEDMARTGVTVIHSLLTPGYSVKNTKNEYQIKRSRKWVHRDIVQSRLAKGESFNSKEIQEYLAAAQKDLITHWEKDKDAYLRSTELGMQLLRKIVEKKGEKEPSKNKEEPSVPAEPQPCTSFTCELERTSIRNRLLEIERDLKVTKDGMELEWSKKMEEREKVLKKKVEMEQQKARKSVERMRKQVEELKAEIKKLQEQLEKSRKVQASLKTVEVPAKLEPIQEHLQKSPKNALPKKPDAPCSWSSSAPPAALPTAPSTTPPTAPTDELEDNECLICLEELESKENEHKCSNCKRRYHAECSSAWLNKKSTCPICKHLMIDPKEFPAL